MKGAVGWDPVVVFALAADLEVDDEEPEVVSMEFSGSSFPVIIMEPPSLNE